MEHPVTILFHRCGPYHQARLQAAAECAPILAIEVVRKDATYQWDVLSGSNGFPQVTLSPGVHDSLPSQRELVGKMRATLDQATPRAIAIPGWSAPEAVSALAWAFARRVPAILMSASQANDYPRNLVGESVKRRVVSLCLAGLVGGRRHREYLASLGMPKEKIFTGYDVVDNAHFREGAEAARADPAMRGTLDLPERYFLASARFVPKKNIPRLLEAYSRYRAAASEGPWDLVLLGNGPMRDEVNSTVENLGLRRAVLLPGFKQYDELPAYYGLAGAFVHASTTEQWGLVVNEAMAAGLPVLVSERCGCAPDLVEQGRNGFTFDPYDVEGLAHLMLRLSTMSEAQRRAMGEASREIISRWTPETFATNLMKAVEVALASPRPKATLLDRALLWALIHRPQRMR